MTNTAAPAAPASPTPTLYSMAFFDAQNLYRHAREAFEESAEDPYHHPCFDPKKLHQKVAAELGCTPNLTRFYTGVPNASDQEMWAGYWANRLLALSRAGVDCTSRKLRYHTENFETDEGEPFEVKVPQEKGIDIRIALDLVSCARRKEFDVAIIFSQDQDLSEAAIELKDIAKAQGRTIKIVSAFPVSETASTARGIDRTDWFPMDKAFYDACIDPRDYRPAKFKPVVK
jgi:uncharacterized LabA/DUF88 family protein